MALPAALGSSSGTLTLGGAVLCVLCGLIGLLLNQFTTLSHHEVTCEEMSPHHEACACGVGLRTQTLTTTDKMTANFFMALLPSPTTREAFTSDDICMSTSGEQQEKNLTRIAFMLNLRTF